MSEEKQNTALTTLPAMITQTKLIADIQKRLSEEYKVILKQTVAKNATDSELAYFLFVATQRGLNPFNGQIHLIKRQQKNEAGEWVDAAKIQTGIDGFRLIAERTGKYAPSPKPTLFQHDSSGNLVSATIWGLKIIGNQAFEFSATAFYSEYVQKKRDGTPTRFWKEMSHSQLEKCAEAKLLRKGFPEELSGLYTHEEMQQAENIEVISSDYATMEIPSPPTKKPEAAETPVKEEEPNLLNQCPDHESKWTKGQWGRYHIVGPGKPLCSLKDILKSMKKALQEELKLDNGQITLELKNKYNKTWSQLSEEQQIEYVESLQKALEISIPDDNP